jgi:hypothetical protein
VSLEAHVVTNGNLLKRTYRITTNWISKSPAITGVTVFITAIDIQSHKELYMSQVTKQITSHKVALAPQPSEPIRQHLQ